jgi:hypothetical protein
MADTPGLSVSTIQLATVSSQEDKMTIDHLMEVEDEAVEDTPTLDKAMAVMAMTMATVLDVAPDAEGREQHHFDQIGKGPEWGWDADYRCQTIR